MQQPIAANTSKKGEVKLKISKLAYLHDDSATICFKNWENVIVARVPSLGQWYDLPSPENKLIDYSSFISASEMSHFFKDSTIDAKDFADKPQVDSLYRQAMAYVAIIDELVVSSDCDCSSLLPALTALKACVGAGWKPATLSKVYIFIYYICILCFYQFL